MTHACDLVAVVDDDADLRAALVQALELEGLQTRAFADAASALGAIGRDFAGVLVTDLRMPGIDGLALFARIAALDTDLPVIVMTGHGDIPTAVDLMGRGAYDFIPKPFSPERLLASVRRALEKRALVLENRALRATAEEGVGRGFVGTSSHAGEVRQALLRLAHVGRPILIEGEPGTGKSLCTVLLHRMSGRRRGIVVMDCATLDDVSGPAALLGHVGGAVPGVSQPRTGAARQADRGTLVLDRIDRLSPALQDIVARVIESAAVVPVGADTPLPVDVAIVATTSCSLAQEANEGRFSLALLHRFSGAGLKLAPLRDRPEDASTLFSLFLAEIVEAAGVHYPVISPEVLARLRSGSFPGNAHDVRALAEEAALELGGVPIEGTTEVPPLSLRAAVARYEAEHIRAALSETGGDIELARARLDLPRKTLYDKLARHGIVAANFRRG